MRLRPVHIVHGIEHRNFSDESCQEKNILFGDITSHSCSHSHYLHNFKFFPTEIYQLRILINLV